VHQLLRTLGGGVGHRIIVGTPEQIADDIEAWFKAGAANGFNLMPDVLPSGLEAFVDVVVPILQRRGLFRTEYNGATCATILVLQRRRAALPELRGPPPPLKALLPARAFARPVPAAPAE
jgi:hypothetical protein